MNSDLKIIKKKYGEKMMHLCRSYMPKILETEGLLPKLLEEHFPFNRHLAEDIIAEHKEEDFKNYLFSLIDVEKQQPEIVAQKSAVELMEEAGYTLYPECQTEEDIHKLYIK